MTYQCVVLVSNVGGNCLIKYAPHAFFLFSLCDDIVDFTEDRAGFEIGTTWNQNKIYINRCGRLYRENELNISDTQREKRSTRKAGFVSCVLVSCGSCNKIPQSSWLKTTDLYSFTVLESRCPKSVLLCPNQGIAVLCFLWRLFLLLQPLVAPISRSIIESHPKWCFFK